MMKQILLGSGSELKLQETDSGILVQKDMVKVEVSACAICGSDLAIISGKRDRSKETYFGHEFAGVVTEMGEGTSGVRPGMRVASELARTCGQCWHCRNGVPNYCRSMNDALSPGGFSQETLVRSTPEYGFLSQLPDSIDDITASLLEPTNCAYRIAMRANLKPGDNVVIFGLGAMGIITAMILKRLGAGNIVAVGRRPARQERVRQTGLFQAVVGNDPQGMQIIQEICGSHGADIVIEATGSAPVLVDAMQTVRYGGRIVVGSVYSGAVQNFEPLPILRREITIVGAKGPFPYPLSDGSSAVVRMMEQIQEDLKKIIKVYDFKDALQAFQDAQSGEAIKAVIRFK